MIQVCCSHSMTEMTVFRAFAVMPLAVLVSCAAPKAVAVVEIEPARGTPAAEAVSDVMPKPQVSREIQDGIRLPESSFLSMPGDTEFRATVPVPSSATVGAVTVRPPSDPVIPPDIGPKSD